MVYKMFESIFPKIARQETRFITIPAGDAIPQGDYGLLPSFCMTKSCDCRRALINVLQMNPNYEQIHAATISYGWEKLGFYREWSLSLSDEMLQEFKGPSLDMMQQQSPYANFFLEFFKSQVITDKEYVRRMQRHYAYVKMQQMKKLPKDLNRLIDYFGECPCGSGKIFRICCGKKKSRLRR